MLQGKSITVILLFVLLFLLTACSHISEEECAQIEGAYWNPWYKKVVHVCDTSDPTKTVCRPGGFVKYYGKCILPEGYVDEL